MTSRRAGARRMLTALGVAILVFQLVIVIGGVSGASWWFTWGPNDNYNRYRISVTVDGRALGAGTIQQRYHTPARGVYEDPIVELHDIIRQYETTYGRADHAHVVVHSRLNGGTETVWRWPRK